MEKRAEDDEKDVYDTTPNCIARGSYPWDATKQDKCAIRNRAKQYRVQDGQLYRVIRTDSKYRVQDGQLYRVIRTDSKNEDHFLYISKKRRQGSRSLMVAISDQRETTKVA